MDLIRIIAYVVFVGVSLLMVLFVLLQEGKGGGLSALGGTQAESAFGASNPIRRMTVFLATIFFVLAGVLAFISVGNGVGLDEPEVIEQTITDEEEPQEPTEE